MSEQSDVGATIEDYTMKITIKPGLVLEYTGYKTKQAMTLVEKTLICPNMEDMQEIVDMCSKDKNYSVLEKLIGHNVDSISTGLMFEFDGPMFGKPW